MALRGLGIVSARLGDFSPHANLGYQYRGSDLDPDVFLITAGFDQLLAPWATLAADLLSEFPVGSQEIPLPQPVVLQAPFRRTVQTTTIPDRRDDMVSASHGREAHHSESRDPAGERDLSAEPGRDAV